METMINWNWMSTDYDLRHVTT